MGTGLFGFASVACSNGGDDSAYSATPDQLARDASFELAPVVGRDATEEPLLGQVTLVEVDGDGLWRVRLDPGDYVVRWPYVRVHALDDLVEVSGDNLISGLSHGEVACVVIDIPGGC